MDPSDRRSVKRRHLIYYLRVWDKDNDKVLGHVVDITTDGLMLISEQEIPLEQNFQLEIRFLDPEKGEKTIAFSAVSRWRSKDINPNFVDTGFQLLDAEKAVLKPIQDLINRYGFHD